MSILYIFVYASLQPIFHITALLGLGPNGLSYINHKLYQFVYAQGLQEGSELVVGYAEQSQGVDGSESISTGIMGHAD